MPPLAKTTGTNGVRILLEFLANVTCNSEFEPVDPNPEIIE
jgi:hypothetical protein